MCRRQLIAAILAGLMMVPAARLDAREGTAGAEPTAEFLQHFQAMLASGFGEDRPNPQAAERHYRALRSLQPDDPRIEYGYGLVLLKLHKHSDGIAHIQRAAKAEPPYLPARRAIVREAIRTSEYSAALDQLTKLAGQIGQPDRREEPASRETAGWIGLAIGFLAGPAEQDPLIDEILEADAAIRRALPIELTRHYDEGQQRIEEIVAKLQTEMQAAQLLAQQRQQKEQSKTRNQLEATESQKQKLEEARKEQQLRTVDTSASLEDQLEQVADRFQSLNKTASSLLNSIQATQLALQQLKAQVDTLAERNRRDWPTEAQILSRSRELDLYVSEFAGVLKAREATARQGKALVARWKKTNSRARRTDQAVSAQVARFEKLNKQLARSLEEANESVPTSPRQRSITGRMRSFSTYDPFDLQQERKRLAAEVGLPDS